MADYHQKARIEALGGEGPAALWDKAIKAAHEYANVTRAMPGTDVIEYLQKRGEQATKAMFATEGLKPVNPADPLDY